RAAFGDGGELNAGVPAEFGSVCCRLNLDFLHGFGNGSGGADRDAQIVVVDAIDHKIVVTGALAVARKLVGTGCTVYRWREKSQTGNIATQVINLHRQLGHNAVRKSALDSGVRFFEVRAWRCHHSYFGGS